MSETSTRCRNPLELIAGLQRTLEPAASPPPGGGGDGAGVEETLCRVPEALREHLGVEQVNLWIPDPAKGTLVPACSNCEAVRRRDLPSGLPIAKSRCGAAFTDLRATFYPSLSTPPASCKPELFAELGLSRMWVVPILAPTLGIERGVVAVASLHFGDGDEIGDLNEGLFEVVGRIVGGAIEAALWREQDLLVRMTAEAMADFGAQLRDPFNRLATAIAESMHFEACTILLADEQHDLLRIIGTTGVVDHVAPDFGRRLYRFGDRPTGRVASERRVVAIEDLERETLIGTSRYPDIVETKDLRQFLGAPVILRGDRLVGVVRLRNKIAPRRHDWPRLLNPLDVRRIERVATILSPLISLVMEESRQDVMIERLRHDLDLPATMVRDFANYYGRVPVERLRDDLGEVRVKLRDVESAMDIILVNGELLQLSREQEITLSPRLTNIYTDSVVKLCKMLTPMARRKHLKRVSYGGGESFSRFVPLHVDPRLFDIALYNLLHNAIKYSHRDTEIEVEGGVSTVGGRTWYEIHVVNFGIGITEAAADRVFHRYFRAIEAQERTTSGVGIGLHTASTLIRLHGGEIVLTRRDTPTVFTIRLPASLATTPPRPAALPAAPAPPSPVASPSRR